MAKKVKLLFAKPEDLSSIPKTHMLNKRTDFCKLPPSHPDLEDDCSKKIL